MIILSFTVSFTVAVSSLPHVSDTFLLTSANNDVKPISTCSFRQKHEMFFNVQKIVRRLLQSDIMSPIKAIFFQTTFNFNSTLRVSKLYVELDTRWKSHRWKCAVSMKNVTSKIVTN
ncbi:hypothetical protein ALC56_06583 [Trachymyrmex septentrionalis]|uniref:Uncharacterized protein n=1 Tax=Trachymyrmex septentrionalis TaxID=34720 RepID=A0A195FG08_9HYME|nr:hypothetical protein ALC56_06583 [Trachymyrmex septentrionalis]